VAVPRWRDGVPATLNVFGVTMSKKAQRNEKRMSPKLKPFPNLVPEPIIFIILSPKNWAKNAGFCSKGCQFIQK
jgi:hypothetical protein